MMENNDIEIMEEQNQEGFWQKKVAMPIVVAVSGATMLVGGLVGCLSGKAWAKKAAKEREAANAVTTQPVPAVPAPQPAQAATAQPEATSTAQPVPADPAPQPAQAATAQA